MTLSEAIRLGAMLKPQSRGALVTNGKTCALGAAIDAAGGLDVADSFLESSSHCYTFAVDQWPVLSHSVDVHPAKGDVRTSVKWVITDMNDSFGWTREQVADWVESVERSLEPESPAAGEALPSDSVSTVNDAEVLIAVSK